MKKAMEQKDSAKAKVDQGNVGNPTYSKVFKSDIGQEDKIELERKEAYIEPKTRSLLRKLLQGGDKEEIIPTYAPSLGFVYQTTDPNPTGDEKEKIPLTFLDNLFRLDILQKGFFDSVSACPDCGSTILTMHNRCPKCRSHNVEKTSLTEHIPCGNIEQKEKYKDDRCPKCGELLVEGQYRNMGRWYVCQECGERFEHPELDLVCRYCNKNFTLKEAQVVKIEKFLLNSNRKKEIRQNVASLEDIRTLLQDLGFNVEIPGLAIGQKSEMQHHFSLMAKKQINDKEIVIALDHAVSELEVQPSPLILYIYKTSEVNVDIPIFIAMPKLNETAKKIAQGHEILTIEGLIEDPETIKNIKAEIENRIAQKTSDGKAADEKHETKQESKSFFRKLKI